MNPVTTSGAPAAIGPYSQAVCHAGIVYCSGQIALHPETGELVGGDVTAQTERLLLNLASVLRAAGSGMPLVLRTTVFLRDMADFAAMNEVYARHFGECRPARSTVAVLGLPRDVRVEIDCIAAVAPPG